MPAAALTGREEAGVESAESAAAEAAAAFFHGAADPFAAAMPGNTDTGFAYASATMALAVTLTVGAAGARGAAGAAGAAGTAGVRRAAPAPAPGGGGGGGGGGGAAAALCLGFGGTSSR